MESQILILNPADKYFPGGTIAGKVSFMLTSTEYIQGVKVELKGKESTEWSEDVTYHDRTNDDIRQGPVRYYGINRLIQKSQNLRQPSIATPGTYDCPFQFDIPTHLPNSYVGTSGEIVYYLKASVILTDNLLLYREVKKITIMGAVNLNYIPNLNTDPVTMSDEATLVACCTGSAGYTLMEVYLPKQVYSVGEIIRPKITISNKAGQCTHQVCVELCKVIMEKVTTPEIKTKYDVQILDSQEGDRVPSNTNRIYNFDFKVSSSVHLHNFGSATLFKEWFVLRVVTRLEETEPLMVETRLTVGHIPLAPSEQTQTIDHMSIPGGTPYPPLPDHMGIPGGTPYPPPQPTAPQGNFPSAPRITGEEDPVNTEELPPSYSEVIRNPNKYSPNRNSLTDK